ncbi:class I SAM-dependent DNA methyltransferase [Pontibacter toksunensis]|uniref:Class I SAM-dependent DNA methyltransferase n=1 Tax=Pontibacter toksunensis TaxID=1332631 RepID=A0ABW6BNY8_9BACT
MPVFKDYAAYYNLLYKDKEYDKEANYIINFIQCFHETAETILNLGCGTGKHDYIFAEKGYDVTGVDMSAGMIDIAKESAKERNLKGSVDFVEGDIREIKLNREYDVVLALFHVMSYQTSNEDLLSAFETAYTHLKPGGILIFDCWYGPGVLSDPPVVRVKHLENENLEVKRIAQPQSHPNENVIDVNYTMIIKEKKTGQYSEITEKHRMRYLFKPELDLYFEKANFNLLHFSEWLKEEEPGLNSWNACFVLKK